MKRTLLILNGSHQALAGIERARAMGLFVVVADMNPEAPGMALADDRIVASIYHPEQIVPAALDYHRRVRPIDGVLCVAADVPLAVARIAAGLGLPGIPVEAARRAVDKLAMKERFRTDGIAIPDFWPLADGAALERLVAEQGRELVVKPVDSRGSRGVVRLGAGVEPRWAFEQARVHSPSGRVMAERYLAGPQVSTESIVIDGRAFTPGFSDRNYGLLERYAPYFVEDGGELPSHLDEATQARVRALVERAAASLGVATGVVKGDIVVHRGEPRVIELAARLSGGYFCTHEIPLNTGVDFVGAAIRLALGEQVEEAALTPRFQRPVAQRYIFPPPGRVVAVADAAPVRALPGVEEVVIEARPGTVFERPTCGPSRAGMVIATGASREEAVARAEAAVAAATGLIEIEPL